MAATDESLSRFHALFDELIVKKLSASGVEKIRDAAALSFHEPAPLVEAIVEAQKRASASTKLAAFYLVDAIVRHARDVIKRKATGGYAYKDAKAPEGSEAKDGSKQAMMEGAKAFLEAVGGVLQDLSVDAMRGVRADQREKIYKIIDIWTKVEVADVELLKALRKAVEALEAELGPGETSADAAAAKEASSSAERKRREASSAARKDKRREAATAASKATDAQAAVTGTKAAATRTPLDGTSSATATPEPTAAPGLPSHLLALLSGNMSSRTSPGAAALSTPPEDGRLSPASAALQSEQPAPQPQPTQPPIVPSTVLSSLANMLGTTTSAKASSPATASGNPALNASQLALLQQLAASGSTPPQRPPQPLPSVSSGASSNVMYARPPPPPSQQQQPMRRPPPPPPQWTQRPPPPSTQNGGPAPASVPRPYPPPSSAQSYTRPPPTTAHPQPPGKPPPPPFGAIRPLGMVGHKPAPSVAQPQPSTHVASPARGTPPVPAEHLSSSSSAGVKRSADDAGHEDTKRARSRSPQKAAPAAAQVTANASIGDMSGFNLATFDATKPEAWTELAQRWYNTQGSHPTQQELLWWLMAMQQQQQMMAWSAQAAWSMEAQGGGVATGQLSDAAAYAQPQQQQQHPQGTKRNEENGRSFEAREVHTG